MIKLDAGSNFITTSNVISVQKKLSCLSAGNLSAPLPLTSIQNISITPSIKISDNIPHSNLLTSKIHRIVNHSPYTACNEKLKLYKAFLRYGCTPQNSETLLAEWEAMLLHTDIRNTPYAKKLTELLPLLKILTEALLSPTIRLTLSDKQWAEVNPRENIIRGLISSASLLPDMLFSTDHTQWAKDIQSVRDALKEELVQRALCRLPSEKISAQRITEETEMHALLHAPPPILQEKLEKFLMDGQAKLLKPIQEEFHKYLQQITHSIAATQTFLNQLSRQSYVYFPMPTDTVHALRTASEKMNYMAKQLAKRAVRLAELKKEKMKPSQQLSLLPSKAIKIFRHGVCQAKEKMEKWHRQIDHESLHPFPLNPVKSFLSLSEQERDQCLSLKKLATPLLQKANSLQRATIQLREALHNAKGEHIRSLPIPQTAITALHVELIMLTENTPETCLLQAMDSIRTVIRHILKETADTHTFIQKTVNKKFTHIIQEYEHVLRMAAIKLRDTLRQVEWNHHQKSIHININWVEKTTQDIKDIIQNALQTISGVARNSGVPWLRKLDIDLHTHWQGITALSEKGSNNYILCGQGQQGMAPAARIHYAVLPLLNEAEKLRGACRSLEMTLNSPANQDTVEKTADMVKNSSLDGLIRAEHSLHDLLSEKNKPIYLCCKNEMPTPVSLRNALQAEARSLLSTARRLQETAWLLAWNADDAAVRQSLVHIRGNLRSIKKRIKDTVETATGVRPHINAPEGMIAKDAAEWLTELKKPPDGKPQNELITALTDRLCEEFTSPHDPGGALFRLRITLALRDAEQGTLIWPLTPQEHLNTVKTPRDYTLAWAEKRLTYSMLYNCLVHYTPAALFSLSRVKNTLVSPLRLINLLLTPVRMAVTRRAMQKVRPGSAAPAELIAEYTAREVYQAVFRTVSLLSPQLFKTANIILKCVTS